MAASPSQTYSASRLDPAFRPDLAPVIDVALAASQTLAKGTVLGRVTATGAYKAYASGNSDGSQTAKVILQYSVTVDGSGNITIEGEWGITRKTAPVFVAGYFRTEDLTGLDAGGVTNLGGCVVKGDLTTGLVRI